MEKLLVLWSLLAFGGCDSLPKETPTVDMQQLTQTEWVLIKEELVLIDACRSHTTEEEATATDSTPTYYRWYENGRFEIGRMDTSAVEHPPPMTIICKGWWGTKQNELALQFTEGDLATATITHLEGDTLRLEREFWSEKQKKGIYQQVFLKHRKKSN